MQKSPNIYCLEPKEAMNLYRVICSKNSTVFFNREHFFYAKPKWNAQEDILNPFSTRFQVEGHAQNNNNNIQRFKN